MIDQRKRSLLWDIFKGFGIIFIVFGHTGKVGGAIVYLFHLALFFFVTGYFFNEDKYGDRPFTYFGHRLAGAWPRYVLYCIFFALTHNYAVRHGLMPEGQAQYNASQFVTSVMSSMVFERPEMYSGPMWFVPLWLLGAVLFAGVVKSGRVLAGTLGRNDPESEEKIKIPVIVILSLLCMLIGLYAVQYNINALYHMELAFVIEPFFAMGYFMKKYAPSWQEKVHWAIMIAVVLIIFFIFTRFIAAGIWFDLASQYIFGMWYYVGGILGIIFTILLSKLVENVSLNKILPEKLFIAPGAKNPVSGLLALLGRYSFDIMAFHIFVFKMLDMVLRKLYYRDPGMDISAYPSPLSNRWWVLYLIVAVFVPLLAGILIDRIKIWVAKACAVHV
ncbi:acyltransferase family protein [Oribacterium sp. WCC10]|uniref:acyltransferase family protein n=1 Tax=Oribacterium sp. WCC10 TaxID=1855343 RepID=UPI0008DFABC3|nr:acyltransferase family protein [Oribacterium sp. WCC10]SFG40066.1 Fucose 4-O-acetylase [Oribacterium sp. WCC10]